MNKLSGLGITMIFLGVWMAIWSSPNFIGNLWRDGSDDKFTHGIKPA